MSVIMDSYQLISTSGALYCHTIPPKATNQKRAAWKSPPVAKKWCLSVLFSKKSGENKNNQASSSTSDEFFSTTCPNRILSSFIQAHTDHQQGARPSCTQSYTHVIYNVIHHPLLHLIPLWPVRCFFLIIILDSTTAYAAGQSGSFHHFVLAYFPLGSKNQSWLGSHLGTLSSGEWSQYLAEI